MVARRRWRQLSPVLPGIPLNLGKPWRGMKLLGRHYFHLHLISDATGETLIAASRAVTAQYEGVLSIEHVYPLVRSKGQLDKAIAEIEAAPGIVLFTLVDQDLAGHLEAACKESSVPCLSVLQPIVNLFQSYIGTASKPRPGAQHILNAEYFKRIEALNFTMMHDDGHLSCQSRRQDSEHSVGAGCPLARAGFGIAQSSRRRALGFGGAHRPNSRESSYRVERKPRFTLRGPPPGRRRTRAGT